ncbi:MAG: hypothetical protein OZ928_16195 [Polyangiaceae bacterium]|nr:hypothetical protein [Polyangiaceae bacterium]
MRRALLSAGWSVAALLAASAASASGGAFSTEYPAVLTVENLGGAMYLRSEVDGGPASEAVATGTFTTFSPAYQPLPRLGFHYFVAEPLSLGLGVHYSDLERLGSSLELAPRVGVALPFDSGTALWLRGGATYFRYDLAGAGVVSGFAPGGEALLVLGPVDHFAFLVGAHFSVSTGATMKGAGDAAGSADISLMQAGLTFGVLADF